MKKTVLFYSFLCFFFLFSRLAIAQVPVISGLSLDASSAENLTTDNLICSYTNGSSVVETASAWYKNGSPDALLYLPFEG
ncbi:MAG: hypothetical protein K8S14_09180, partial [Actinomycetia bacterium]|nr:hypothetical protein [Actinomycetes bacterium]